MQLSLRSYGCQGSYLRKTEYVVYYEIKTQSTRRMVAVICDEQFAHREGIPFNCGINAKFHPIFGCRV